MDLARSPAARSIGWTRRLGRLAGARGAASRGLWALAWLAACSPRGGPADGVRSTASERDIARTGLSVQQTVGAPDRARVTASDHADVLGVVVRGEPRAYTFSVTLRSPDTGCDRYAAWWEVLGSDGSLRYRRVLEHSHVDEQPFARSGGPVEVGPDDELWVRAWLQPGGYGGRVMRGSARGGFVEARPPDGLGAGAELQPPLPSGCRF